MNEREMEVLERYPFRAARISRVRGAFLCETEAGLRLLKETESTEKRLQWENEILKRFADEGRQGNAGRQNSAGSGIPVDYYVENQDGELLTESADHRKYFVKQWYEGRECSMGDTAEILRTVELLARLHIRLGEISAEIKNEDSDQSLHREPDDSLSEDLKAHMGTVRPGIFWISDLDRHNKELVRARNFIRKKRHKSELELKILEDFPYYYEQAVQALALAKEGGELPVLLYHGDFSHHHILWHGAQAAVIEFSHMGWGIQQEDLYLFLRKALEKHGWNKALGLSMIQRYESVKPLTWAERRYLYARMVYPEKFWKQVNYYCNRKKSWVPLRNLEKLKVLERQREAREDFLYELKCLWS